MPGGIDLAVYVWENIAMEESDNGRGWIFWLLVVPAALATGALLTRWALQRPAPAPQAQVAESAPPRQPAMPAAQPAESQPFDLPGDEPDSGEPAVSWGKEPAAATGAAGAASAAGAAADPGESKKSFGLGLACGALTKASEKLLNNPKALGALFNNDYVVKGFMSRDTVKQATASPAALAAYLKNPANMNKFMAKAPVQSGMNNRELVNAVASSKLAGAMLDTPGGKALLKDPSAMADILKANPGLINVLGNPVMIEALMNNPKTAGVVTQITMSGAGR